MNNTIGIWKTKKLNDEVPRCVISDIDQSLVRHRLYFKYDVYHNLLLSKFNPLYPLLIYELLSYINFDFY